jgi:type IV pilus assembly protein PilB
VPSINLAQFEIDPRHQADSDETAQKYQIIPLSRAGATLDHCDDGPDERFAMDDIKFMTGYNVEPVVASETAVAESITRYYARGKPAAAAQPRPAAEAPSRWPRARSRRCPSRAPTIVEVLEDLEEISAESLEKQGGDAPVIKLVNVVLMSAIQKGASDIHIEPYEKEFRVRYRVDGILYNIMAPPMKMRDAITSRIKIMAKLDIAEKRLPQDGRIKIRFSDNGQSKDIDFRVSCLPTLFGEKIVMRCSTKTSSCST